jgi:hypothetical protein
MMLGRALIFVTFGMSPGFALAQTTEIYKCVDRTGRPLYTSDRRDTSGKKCALVSREVNVVPGLKGKPTASRELGRFPRETPAQAANAKGLQRQVLEKELATEQAALAKARQDLAEQGPVKNAGSIKDNIETHEKNIQALQRELSNLR